jgi:glycosyltransferase involved in cell wall biosynthesis
MNILMLCYEFPPLGGGGGRMAYGLSKTLIKMGHQVDAVTMGFRGLPTHERIDGINVYRIPCIRRKLFLCNVLEASVYLLLAFPKIRYLVQNNAYHIIHTHFILPDGLMSCLIKLETGQPYIITAHGSDVPGYNPDRLRFAHRLLTPVWRIVTTKADHIIWPSSSIQKIASQQPIKTHNTIIPYGFEINQFQPQSKRKKRILVVTRMLRRKGVQHLIKALDELNLEHSIHIVGDGPYLPVLRKIAANVNAKIKFYGWLNNGSPLFRHLLESSQIFVLPSEAENFPVALLEAMSAGLAIITTKGTGCEDVVGDTGVLVKPRKVHELSCALIKLTENLDLCKKIGKASRERVENYFSWPVVAKQYINLYNQYSDY